MDKNYLTLEKISAYKKSFSFANYVWNIVTNWGHFEKDTIGKQVVRSADSVSANIAEGFGRFSKKDKVRFYRISLGSLIETIDWVNKSKSRNLIQATEYENIIEICNELKIEIYHLIKYTNEKLKF